MSDVDRADQLAAGGVTLLQALRDAEARVRALTDAGNTLAAATYKFDDPAVDALVCAWRALVGDADKAPEGPVSPVQPREAGQPIIPLSDAPCTHRARTGEPDVNDTIGSEGWLRERFPDKDWHRHPRTDGRTDLCDGTPSDCPDRPRVNPPSGG